MNIAELRIGNFIQTDGKVKKITGVITYGVYFSCGYCPNVKGLIKPIPITEEWLIKFGFDVNSFGFATKNNFQTGHITKDENYQFEFSVGMIGKWFLKDILSVHQLQNIFHALTGEELTIKDNEE